MSFDSALQASQPVPMERVTTKLENLPANGQDLSRKRFSRSPPSPESTVPTASPSPTASARLRDELSQRKFNSTASWQFGTQVEEEMERIRMAREKGLTRTDHPWEAKLSHWRECAQANVACRWTQQGIWSADWELGKVWKHEVEAYPQLPPEPDHFRGVEPTLKQQYNEIKTALEDRQKWRSSQPCFVFTNQFYEERQWIIMGLSGQDQDESTSIDTKAYEAVKSRWIRDGIWDEDWTFIPGVAWKHEQYRIRDQQSVHPVEDTDGATSPKQVKSSPDSYFLAPSILYHPLHSPQILPQALPSATGDSSPNISERSYKWAFQQGLQKYSVPSDGIDPSGPARLQSSQTSPAKVSQAQKPRTVKHPAEKPTAKAKRSGPNGKSPRRQKNQTPNSSIAKPRLQNKRQKEAPLVDTTAPPRSRRPAALEAREKFAGMS